MLAFGLLAAAIGTGCSDDGGADLPSRGGSSAGAAAGRGGSGGSQAGAGGSNGGAGGSAGSAGSGGTSGGGGSSAGNAGAGGAAGSGGSGAGGDSGSGGNAGSAGSGGSAGSSGAAGSGGSGGGTPGGCNGAVTSLNLNPFGCEFAWGTNGAEQNRASYLQFVTGWIGSEPQGGLTGTCYGCQLIQQIAATDAIPVLYGYIIGEAGHQAGLPDCNVGGPPNLCTHGAKLIRDHRAELIEKYANYARMVARVSGNKPVVWLLEGDFMQYTESTQGAAALDMDELGRLAADIVCAIKGNHPKAVVAINHITWNSNEETDLYWSKMPLAITDMVWTTGVGDNQGFINQDGNASSYNATTARYRYVHDLTGKTIFVDTSFGPSLQADSWSNNDAATLDARIAEGVVAANVTNPPSDYQSRIQRLATASTCRR